MIASAPKTIRCLAALWLLSRPLLAGDFSVKQAVVPIFKPGESRPIGQLRLGSMAPGYQKRGFFRIGALPQVTVQDVAVELPSAEHLADVFDRLPELLPVRGGEQAAFEARHLRLVVRSGDTSTLAVSISEAVYRAGVWRLKGVRCASEEIAARWGQVAERLNLR